MPRRPSYLTFLWLFDKWEYLDIFYNFKLEKSCKVKIYLRRDFY